MRGKYKVSKCIYKSIADNLDKNEFEQYYMTHLCKDVAEHFGFHERYLNRILHYLNIEVGSRDRQSYIQKLIVLKKKDRNVLSLVKVEFTRLK